MGCPYNRATQEKRAPCALVIMPCAASQKNDSFFKTSKGMEKRKKVQKLSRKKSAFGL
jgi:hypothetical protein